LAGGRERPGARLFYGTFILWAQVGAVPTPLKIAKCYEKLALPSALSAHHTTGSVSQFSRRYQLNSGNEIICSWPRFDAARTSASKEGKRFSRLLLSREKEKTKFRAASTCSENDEPPSPPPPTTAADTYLGAESAVRRTGHSSDRRNRRKRRCGLARCEHRSCGATGGTTTGKKIFRVIRLDRNPFRVCGASPLRVHGTENGQRAATVLMANVR